MKRDKNIKITSKTHEMLKTYCEKNGLKMFGFVERLIREKCTNEGVKPRKDIYQED